MYDVVPSTALGIKCSCLPKWGLAVATLFFATGCVATVGIEGLKLNDDAGAPTGSDSAAGRVIGTSTTAGISGTASTSSATSATASGTTTSTGAGGSAGSGPTGSGASGGASGIGGSGGIGGGAGGSGAGGSGAGGSGATGMDGGVVLGVVRFSTDVAPIIQRRCSSCHSNFSTYATFTTHSVSQCGGDVLARANDLANSGFLELVQGQCGGFLMPRGCGTAPCIPQSEINTVTSWIKAGAPNN